MDRNGRAGVDAVGWFDMDLVWPERALSETCWWIVNRKGGSVGKEETEASMTMI